MKALVYVLCAIGFAAFSNVATAQEIPLNDGYNFLYATADSDISDEILNLLAEFNGVVVYSDDEFAVYNTLFGVDAFWFDASALAYLDTRFLPWWRDVGVSITAFNVEPAVLADLFDEPSLAERYTLTDGEIVYVTLQQIQMRPAAQSIVPYDRYMLPAVEGQQSFSVNRVGSLSRPDERQGFMTIAQDIAQLNAMKRDVFRDFQESLRSE